MDINKIRQGSAPQPSSGTTAAGSVDQSSSGPSSAGNLGSSTASGAEVVRSGQVFDRGQTLALSGVSAPTVELATTAWADGQAVVARFQKPAMAVTDLAALIMLLEEVIRVLKSKDRLAQQADSDASLTTDMAAVSKMRTSAADKLEANKKQSNFQMIAGAVQIGMAGAGAFKLRAAGKAASRLGKISSETKDLTNNLKVATGKAAKSDIRQAMRMLREESAAVSNKCCNRRALTRASGRRLADLPLASESAWRVTIPTTASRPRQMRINCNRSHEGSRQPLNPGLRKSRSLRTYAANCSIRWHKTPPTQVRQTNVSSTPESFNYELRINDRGAGAVGSA